MTDEEFFVALLMLVGVPPKGVKRYADKRLRVIGYDARKWEEKVIVYCTKSATEHFKDRNFTPHYMEMRGRCRKNLFMRWCLDEQS
jgi:hypothetical protein